TAVTNGTVIVRATANDGSGVFGETTITITNQNILVTNITVQGQGGATTINTNGGTLQMVETVLPANATNQAVTWSITGGTGSGTISGTGLLTAVTNGTVIVRATANDGSGVFGETTIMVSGQNILVTSITVQGQGGATTITTNGGTLQMVETVLPGLATNQAVTWSITAGGTGTGTISGTGLLTAVTNGTVIVRATANDGSGVFGEETITISNQTVMVTSITVQGQGGATTINTNGGMLQMIETVLPANATNQTVSWSVDNGLIANINTSGMLTALNNGIVTVTATAQDGSGVSGSAQITISNQTVLVDSIIVQGQGGVSTITAPSGNLQMLATIIPSNAINQNVAWSVDNPGIAVVNSSGMLTAISNGVVTVTATAQDGSGVTGSTQITISNQPIYVTSISVQGQGGATTISVPGGDLLMLATILPANATNQTVSWSVDDPSIAIIKSSGILVAKSDGIVTVTATAQDGSGVSGSTQITISNQPVLVNSLTVQGQGGISLINANNGSLQMLATILPANATNQNVAWSVNNPAVASINTNGILNANSDGVVTVTATATDGSGLSGSAQITVSNQKIFVTSITVQGQGGANTISTNGGTLQMEATILPANATNQNVAWTVDDPVVAVIDPVTGVLTALTNGAVTVWATAQDGSGVRGSTVINISNQGGGTGGTTLVSSIQVLASGGQTAISVQGATLQMFAVLNPTNATNLNVSWSVSSNALADIDQNGVLTAKANGTVLVIATAQDGSGISGSLAITISNQQISVEETEEEEAVSTLKAYPNPFGEVLNLELDMVDFADDAQLLLFDVRGQLLRQESHNLMQGENIIQLNGLQDMPSGMYILQIRTSEETLMRQLIKR
ncbi:MAG: T9SS type A sorting domain-containing protein, partial [Aureispira sp.]|nr:T9SS type A sorting domain-containing protein [Aureispira sp.]